jgi:hypothetical protein
VDFDKRRQETLIELRPGSGHVDSPLSNPESHALIIVARSEADRSLIASGNPRQDAGRIDHRHRGILLAGVTVAEIARGTVAPAEGISVLDGAGVRDGQRYLDVENRGSDISWP